MDNRHTIRLNFVILFILMNTKPSTQPLGHLMGYPADSYTLVAESHQQTALHCS